MNKKIELQISELRNIEIKMAKLQTINANFNRHYRFFYDETNNVRRLRLKENRFNFQLNKNFILGGLAIIGDLPDLSVIRSRINLQHNVNEIKFKYIAKGSFSDCLKSKILEICLQTFLETENLYIHYHNLDFLYWSLVDIVDSVLTDEKCCFHLELKNSLYLVAKKELSKLQTLLIRSNYPNIAQKELPNFINFLIELLSKYVSNKEFGYWVKILISELEKKKKSGDRLEFVMDEKEGEFLKNFLILYLRPIENFIYSEHIFDNEDSISPLLENYQILYEDMEIKHYKFVDSQQSLFVQLSDVFVGIMGKYIECLNKIEQYELKDFITALNEQQIRNLQLIYALEDKSDSHNQVLLNHVAPLNIRSKSAIMFEELKKKLCMRIKTSQPISKLSTN